MLVPVATTPLGHPPDVGVDLTGIIPVDTLAAEHRPVLVMVGRMPALSAGR